MARYEFDQFVAVRHFGGVAYAPTGDRLAYIANTSGQFNLWVMPAGGGFPRQLTAFAERRVTSLAWSPDGRRIAFTADRHGDEMHQLFVVDAAGSWPRQLTDAPQVQYTLSGWTPDGKQLVITGNDREPTEMDPQLLDVETGAVTRLLTGGLYYAAEVSPDGRYLTVVEIRGNTDQEIHLLDLESGERRAATPHEGEVVFFPGPWARDASGFYLLTSAEREYRGVAFYELASGGWRYVHAPEHDVEQFALARDGRTTLAGVNVAGSSQLQAYDPSANRELPAPELPLGVVGQLDLHPSERKAVLIYSTPQEAPNLFEVDLDSGGVRALEQSMLGGIDPADLALPELIHYPSFDRKIPAWLYRPAGDGPFPVVLSIHGGPESQERPNYAYTGLYQFLLDRGIGVLAPNIRGSTGYGISYQKLIHRDWGGAELEDIRHAAEYLRGLDWVDKERIAIFGGSFGGFACLSALSRLPEYWAVGVDVVGPSNLVTFARTVPPHWRELVKRMVGDPDEDREFLLARSPITYVDQIRAPLLVIQGANDPRVVKAESDQMVARMRERGLEVEYYVDEKSGHGPASREDIVRWFRMIAEYLEAKLTAPKQAPASAPAD